MTTKAVGTQMLVEPEVSVGGETVSRHDHIAVSGQPMR
jgi:hypothetical protein